jgi:hypothetical protein
VFRGCDFRCCKHRVTWLGLPALNYEDIAMLSQHLCLPIHPPTFENVLPGPISLNETGWQLRQGLLVSTHPHTGAVGAAKDHALTSFRCGMTGITKYEFL